MCCGWWFTRPRAGSRPKPRAWEKSSKRAIRVTIVIDFVHVLQYLWNAAGCLFPDGDPAAAQWVHHQATRVLEGHARKVAGTIRRQATNARLERARRKPADEAAAYLTNNAPYLNHQLPQPSAAPTRRRVARLVLRANSRS